MFFLDWLLCIFVFFFGFLRKLRVMKRKLDCWIKIEIELNWGFLDFKKKNLNYLFIFFLLRVLNYNILIISCGFM